MYQFPYYHLATLVAERSSMASKTASGKWPPPKLDNDGSYETWKKDLEIWTMLTDLPKGKQGLAVHLSLDGRARIATSELKVEDLSSDTGVVKIIEKLDSLFLPDKGRRQFTAFKNLYNLRRQTMNFLDYITTFEHSYYKFKMEGMELPDPVIAFMLLAASELTDSELKLIMSAINEVSYANVKATLKRVFDTNVGENTEEVSVKQETLFSSEKDTDGYAYYTRGWGVRGRGSRRSYPRGGFNARYRSDSAGRQNSLRDPSTSGEGNNFSGAQGRFNATSDGRRRTNPRRRDGEISRCAICNSIFHWARQCPDSYEATESKETAKEGNENERRDEDHLSMFVAYTSGKDDRKMSKLLDQATNCAVIDTGCLTTVSGATWAQRYLDSLSEFERGQVSEENSTASYTFGDGRTYFSSKKLTIPCYIGPFTASITTDIVTAEIPMLLSKTSMKKQKMMIDFANDALIIKGKSVSLESSSTGHYILRLSR